MATTERPFGPQSKPHPGVALRIPKHRETQQSCEIYWRIRQGKPDQSTDRVGAPHDGAITVTPDMINTARPNTTDKAHPSYVAI